MYSPLACAPWHKAAPPRSPAPSARGHDVGAAPSRCRCRPSADCSSAIEGKRLPRGETEKFSRPGRAQPIRPRLGGRPARHPISGRVDLPDSDDRNPSISMGWAFPSTGGALRPRHWGRPTNQIGVHAAGPASNPAAGQAGRARYPSNVTVSAMGGAPCASLLFALRDRPAPQDRGHPLPGISARPPADLPEIGVQFMADETGASRPGRKLPQCCARRCQVLGGGECGHCDVDEPAGHQTRGEIPQACVGHGFSFRSYLGR